MLDRLLRFEGIGENEINCTVLRADNSRQCDYIEQVLEAINNSSYNNLITNTFKKIFVMSRKNAKLYFVQRAEIVGQELSREIEVIESNFDKAIILFLGNRCLFDNCYYVRIAELQGNRYWTARNDYIPENSPALTDTDKERLVSEIENYLLGEMRGQNCTIQKECELLGKDYVFLASKDFPTEIEHYRDEVLENDIFIPVFKIALVYDRQRGLLDVCCDNAKTRKEIHKVFANIKFGIDDLEENPTNIVVYDLDYIFRELITRQRLFIDISNTPIIRDIFPKAMTLLIDGERKIKIDTCLKKRYNREGEPDDIYEDLSEVIKLSNSSPNTIDLSRARLIKIEFTAIYHDGIANKDVPKKFTISGRNGCNLGHDEIDEQIRDCLINSDIIRNGE